MMKYRGVEILLINFGYSRRNAIEVINKIDFFHVVFFGCFFWVGFFQTNPALDIPFIMPK